MKVTLEYDLENEVEAEKYRCALKAYEMSGLIDSFLDYIYLVHKLPVHVHPPLSHVYLMYLQKIVDQGLVDMVEEDLRDLFEGMEPTDAEEG